MRIAAAGLLVAAIASARPALGHCPDEKCGEAPRAANPWRSARANPWRGEVEAPPQTPAPRSLEVELHVPNLTWSYSYHGPAPAAPAPRPVEEYRVPLGQFTAVPGPCPTGWFISAFGCNACDGPKPIIISTYSDRPMAQLTIEDVVRISGRDPVTLAPVPGCCQQAVGVRVNETRTGQFMIGGSVNSASGIGGTIVINERNCDVVPCPACTAGSAAVARPANKLHGTWYRELPGAVVAFTFCGDELKATGNVNIDGVSGCVTLTAEYAMSKDGTVHGVITGADATGCGGDLGALEMVSVAVVAQMFVDQPFAFRMKSTGDGLMLSNVRFPAAEPLMEQGPGPKMSGLLCGLYRPAKNGVVPTAKALKMPGEAATGEPCCDGLLDVLGALFGKQTPLSTTLSGMTLPSPTYPQHYPQYFPPTGPYPVPYELAAQAPCLPMPHFAPLPGTPYPPAEECPVPAPPLPAGAVVPYLPPGCVPPPMVAFPPPPPQLVRAEMVPTRTAAYVGEWNRTYGPCTIGLSLTANQVTAKGMVPVNGEPLRVVITADCREIRDGLVAGVITCAEVEPVGKTDQWDNDPGRLRGLVDQPFSCRFQVRGDELIVIDVKVGGEHAVEPDDLGIIAGRYAKGEPKWPTAGKVKKGAAAGNGAAIGAAAGATTGSATGYPKTGTVADDVMRIGIDFNARPIAIPFVQPGSPGTVLPMFPPEPLPLPEPPVPDKPRGKKKKGAANAYSADPNVRIEQLLRQSEDLRQVGEQWRRAWFNDQPSHLTPERVHGGVN
jgi:hypothetical protein